ncbi:MAG: phytanoyl-CoA dioxygenase family protein [Halobaculum sp.]
MSRETALTEEQVRTYHEQGYVGPLEVVSPSEMAEIRAVIDEQRAEGDGYRDNPYMARHLDCPAVYELCARSEITDAVESILGENLLLWSTTLFEKEPGGTDFAWHQDQRYFQLEPPLNVSAWIALTDSTVKNGCMQVIPGSHKEVVPHIENPARPVFDKVAHPDHVDEDEAVDIELSPGECILFNERLLHRSRENTADRRRFGLSARITKPYCLVGADGPKLVLSGSDPFGYNPTTDPPGQ